MMRPHTTLDKSAVRAHFQRAAKTYDAAALIAREAGERMFTRLAYLKHQPSTIVDLGSGTGYFSQKLAKHYRHAQLLSLDFSPAMLQQARVPYWRRWLTGGKNTGYLCADMEAMPLRSQSVDMIWANCSLLWQDTPEQTLAECYRVLSQNGLLIFCTLGPDTLTELRQAFSGVDTYAHVHRFIDMHDLGDALVRQGFSAPVMEMEVITVSYDEATTLLRDLQAAGFANALTDRRTGLMGKRAWQKMLSQYAGLRTESGLPATYEVIYGHAWKEAPRRQAEQQAITFYNKVAQ